MEEGGDAGYARGLWRLSDFLKDCELLSNGTYRTNQHIVEEAKMARDLQNKDPSSDNSHSNPFKHRIPFGAFTAVSEIREKRQLMFCPRYCKDELGCALAWAFYKKGKCMHKWEMAELNRQAELQTAGTFDPLETVSRDPNKSVNPELYLDVPVCYTHRHKGDQEVKIFGEIPAKFEEYLHSEEDVIAHVKAVRERGTMCV